MMKQQRFRLSRLHAGMLLALGAGVFNTTVAQEELEEIQVTGSRISRTTMDTPTPVTTMQATELAAMAPGNLIEGLSQMPQFYGNLTPEGVNGGQNAGGSNVNLRGGGSNRTLTLLNGRRVVPSNRFGAVDVNLFPEDLLRSVETVTGGASASYGTDAVAGVVNFILNTDYEGFKTHAQTGITEYGDGRTWEVGAAFGRDLGNGLHILGSVAAYDQAKISSFGSVLDRDYLIRSARITNPTAGGPTDIIRPYAKPTTFTPTGILIDNTRPSLNRQVFDTNGNLSPLDFTGVGALTTGCLCYSDDDPNNWGIERDMELGNAFRRYNGFLYLDYELSPNTTVFGQAMYADNSASDQRESITLQSIWQGRVYPDNAFLSTQARDLIVASGAPFVGYGLAAANTPETVLGESRQETNNEMYSFTGGFDHEFAFGWNLNGYYQYGKNIQDFVTVNGVRVDRLQFAFDAVRHPTTNEIICRVNLPQFTGPIASGGNGGLFSDCAPINTFGGIQNISQAGADYVMDRDGKIARQWTDQHMFELVTSGELFDGFGAGAVDAAFGVSWRKEALDQRTLNPADEYPAQVNGTLLSAQGLMPVGVRGVVPQGSTAVPGFGGIPGLRFVPNGYLGDANSSSVLFSSLREIAGGYNVKEAFAEFNWPLLADMNLVQMLEVNTAARWADYSGSGDIWAWKFSANWTINDELRVRATRSRDVRAASLRERYDQTRGGANVANPWDNRNAVQAASLSGGNPNVSPEEADTTTAGIVYQPEWFDGFSASLDWYSIDIDGALAQLGAQNIVDNCFRGELSLCQYVISGNGPVTNPTNGAFRTIDRVEAIFINLQTQKIEGVDMELQYRTDVNFFGNASEDLGIRFLTSYLDENSVQSQGGNLDDRAGQIGGFGLADVKVTTNMTYNIDNWSLFLQGRWISDGKLDRTRLESDVAVPLSARPAGSLLAACGTNICTLDDNSIPSTFYMDARIGGRFGQNENLEVFANIQNLLDRAPVITPGSGVGRTGTGPGVNTGLYDLLGRRYTIGVNYEF
jgi:outer membrane receptor protein involved in Fe transport